MSDDGFGEGVVSCPTIYMWYKRFKDSREKLGQSSTGVNYENEARVYALLMRDCHMCIRMLAGKLNMGKDRVAIVLKEKIHRKKVYSQFVLHFLTLEQKQHCPDCCQDFIKTSAVNRNFLTSFVTRDKSWCFQYNPLTKCQSSAWLVRVFQNLRKCANKNLKWKPCSLHALMQKGWFIKSMCLQTKL